MHSDKDKILLRAKDIGLLVMVFTLLGFIVGPMKQIFQIEQTIEDVKQLKEREASTRTSIAVINAQYSDIQKQLEQMNYQLRRLQRGVPGE